MQTLTYILVGMAVCVALAIAQSATFAFQPNGYYICTGRLNGDLQYVVFNNQNTTPAGEYDFSYTYVSRAFSGCRVSASARSYAFLSTWTIVYNTNSTCTSQNCAGTGTGGSTTFCAGLLNGPAINTQILEQEYADDDESNLLAWTMVQQVQGAVLGTAETFDCVLQNPPQQSRKVGKISLQFV